MKEIGTQEWAEANPAPTTDPQASQASIQLLILALKTLSQRTLVALAALKYLLLAGSVFWLAFTVLQEPSVLKLVGLGIYSGFVLLGELLVRR